MTNAVIDDLFPRVQAAWLPTQCQPLSLLVPDGMIQTHSVAKRWPLETRPFYSRTRCHAEHRGDPERQPADRRCQ